MKTLSFMAVILSLTLMVSCGNDKKKKNNQQVLTGQLQNCQPNQTLLQQYGQQTYYQIQQMVYQSCIQQVQSNPALQQYMRDGRLYFSIPYTQNIQQYPQQYPGAQGFVQPLVFTGGVTIFPQ